MPFLPGRWRFRLASANSWRPAFSIGHWNVAMANTKFGDQAGRFAYEGLDRVIHEKARLSILASLATHPNGLVFIELKDLCSLTDGNLSRHLQILQEAGFVQIWKGYKDNRPQTLCQLTSEGRRRFLDYLAELENVVNDALKAPASKKVAEGLSPA